MSYEYWKGFKAGLILGTGIGMLITGLMFMASAIRVTVG